jgi:hypothetical protein
MSPNKHITYFEVAKVDLSEARLKFNIIPDLGFINAFAENTKNLELYFPTDKTLGDLVEVADLSWSFSIRAARLTSDMLVEEYVRIESFSNIRHLVLELDASHDGFNLHSDHIATWQQALANFSNLETLKIVLKLSRRNSRGKAGAKKKEALEPILSDLRAYFRYPDGKVPETTIEMG